jgi:Fe-S cluster assembly iron-binding protein IscA
MEKKAQFLAIISFFGKINAHSMASSLTGKLHGWILMIHLTKEASKEISRALEKRDGALSVRIYVNNYGIDRTFLDLIMDTPNKDDQVEKKGDVNVVIEKRLYRHLGDINIDFENDNWPLDGRFLIHPAVKRRNWRRQLIHFNK